MISTLELILDLDTADDPTARRALAAAQLNVEPARIAAVRVRRRSLDARGAIKVHLQCEVYIDEEPPAESLPEAAYTPVNSEARRVVIVGCGPAGMFAALRLLELGYKPIVVERGKDVQARRRDLALINREGIVDADSNYGFGEGGAGTYSDGKLYTRVKNKALISGVLNLLVAHGAHPEILVEAHPHIGSNKLPKIVAALRETIRNAGGEVHFGARVVDFLFDSSRRMTGVTTADGREFSGEAVVLAAGHSAREIFELLHRHKVRIEAKPFAMGVRIEHPQPLIDKIQYRGALTRNAADAEAKARGEWRHPKLPAAAYRLAATVEERGVFSFCMCPGGWIVPAATAPGEVVVNGMSLSRRDSPFANSGLVVAVEEADLQPFAAHGALAGLRYQESLEKMALEAGGGAQRAPAQRVTDFVGGKISGSLPACSYQPGLTSAPLHELLPPSIAHRLQGGLKVFGRNLRGYLTEDALLIGVESRTSSPVRVPRSNETLQHVEIEGLYPCGEGAGYAGGIVSAAIDGVRVADAIAGH